MSLEYNEYLKEHISYVSTGLRWLEENLDLSDLGITSGDFSEAHWRATEHDRSKYDKEEYDAYDAYFYGGNRSHKVVEDFNYAWLHHIHHNPHHWQYWVLINDDEKDGTVALEMPKSLVLEMIADWWTFSWRNEDLFEILEWYEKHRERMILHKNTRKLVCDILFGKMRPKLVEQTMGIAIEELEELHGNHIEHHGILGQKWGIRRFQNKDGTRTSLGKAKEHEHTVFISGSSKTQSKDSPYYRDELPKDVQKTINDHIKNGDKIIVGDAPGIDRQVQDYLNETGYDNVEIYGPGKDVRYSANKNWKTNPIDAPEYEEGSKEWLAKKDKAMSDAADEGLAVILDEGAAATRKNIKRLIESEKDVKVFELSKNGANEDNWHISNSLIQERRDVLNKKLDKDFDQELVDLIGLEILSSLGLDDELEHSGLDEEELKKRKYAFPEQRKFPMPDADHVRSAIRFFNYVDPKDEETLAKAILERMKEYGMTFDDFTIGDENRFKNYIPKEEKEKE